MLPTLRRLASLALAVVATGCVASDDAVDSFEPTADPAGYPAGFPPPDAGGEPADEIAAACARTRTVSSTAQLSDAIRGAKPGDCIVLEDGTYAFDVVRARGTEASPIAIRARNRGKARVTTGQLRLDGAAFVTVEGLLWTSAGNVVLNNCDHCRISRSSFRIAETGELDWITVNGTSRHARIDHNDLGPKRVIGNLVMLGGKGSQVVQDTRIDHNYFHDVTNTGGNGWESIRAGLSGFALSSGRAIIEHNLFERCDGDPETISIKSSDNVIRYNTLRATRGEITLRHGNRNQLIGNFVLGDKQGGTSGIRVLGKGHRIFDNHVQDIAGTGIFLEGGSSDADEAGVEHYRVHDAVVVHNTIVGAGKGIQTGGAHPLAPVGCTVANNLVQGKSGALFSDRASVDTTYLGNVGNPQGGTSLGLSRPADEVLRQDPKLVSSGGILRLSASSPVIGKARGSFPFVVDDIDGNPRAQPDVGADEFSASAPLRRPLTAADVGPDAP